MPVDKIENWLRSHLTYEPKSLTTTEPHKQPI